MRLFLITLLFTINSFSQSSGTWIKGSDLPIKVVTISKSGIQNIGLFELKTLWDDKLSYSSNIGYYGGIKELSIYLNGTQVNVLKNIEDYVALGDIRLEFFDFNFDGILDFRMPISCGRSCNFKYYIFNLGTNQFDYSSSWDYLRILKVNFEALQIIPIPDGNYDNERKLYQINGMRLDKLF